MLVWTAAFPLTVNLVYAFAHAFRAPLRSNSLVNELLCRLPSRKMARTHASARKSAASATPDTFKVAVDTRGNCRTCSQKIAHGQLTVSRGVEERHPKAEKKRETRWIDYHAKCFFIDCKLRRIERPAAMNENIFAGFDLLEASKKAVLRDLFEYKGIEVQIGRASCRERV